MQIIVPAAGRGSRFLEQGYTDPKPLIDLMGKPLIKWSTDGLRGAEDLRYIFLVQQDHIDNHGIDRRLLDLYPGCEIVPVKTVTEGAACTVLLAKERMDLDEELLIVNCDNLFSLDISRAKQMMDADTAGLIFYFASTYAHWSYVQVDDHGRAVRVAEKEIISDRATVGCYYFRTARLFVEAAELMIKQNIRTKGEFYVSPVYNLLIEQGKTIQTFPCDLHYSLGTPEELNAFRTIFDPTYAKANAIVRG